MEQVVLVDENDAEVGVAEKLEAHKKGLLHRAFSVFLFNDENELLLQQRADHKYHSPGLWTNTCCSHPRPNEPIIDAAKRRLVEEMGITAEVAPQFSFLYKTGFENGLIEHELDHVLFGKFTSEPVPNEEEVKDWKFVSLHSVERDLINKPEEYTFWFKEVFPKIKELV